jgi:hypothetical protein
MSGNNEICTTIGWYYIIENVYKKDNEFYIYDDQRDCHYFNFNNYKKFFYHQSDINKIRKIKLNKLNSIK